MDSLPTESGRRPLVWLLGICCGVSLAAAFGVQMAFQWFDPFEARSFVPDAWAVANPEGRAAMAHDALRRIVPQMSTNDIKRMFGPPGRVWDSRRLIANPPRGAVKTYDYDLGTWSVRYYDETSLWIHFDQEGKVIQAVIGGG